MTYIPGPKVVAEEKVEESLLLLEFLGLVDEGSANKVRVIRRHCSMRRWP